MNSGCASSGVPLFNPQVGMMTLLVRLFLVAQACLSAFWPAEEILGIRGNGVTWFPHSRHAGVTALIWFLCWLVLLLGGRMLQWIRCSTKSEDALTLIGEACVYV